MVFHHQVCAVLWYAQDYVMCNIGLCALLLYYVYIEAFVYAASESKTNFPYRVNKVSIISFGCGVVAVVTIFITNDDPQYEVGVISGLLTEILVDSDRSAASALESGNRKCAHTGVHKNMGNSVADDDHGWGKKNS